MYYIGIDIGGTNLKAGLVDEVVAMGDLRSYLVAFAEAAYQNPASICPHHQMMLPRVIADYDRLHTQREEG